MNEVEIGGESEKEGWHADPTGRHELRYHNGLTWSHHVADGGRRSTDEFASSAVDQAPPPPPSDAKLVAPVSAPLQSDRLSRDALGPQAGLSFSEAVSRCLSQYATFSGRAPRSEYWWFWLSYAGALVLAPVGLAWLTGSADLAESVWTLSFFALITPYLAVGARRLHDTGSSGWWQLLMVVPLGAIALLIMLARKGEPEQNRWGPPTLS